MSFCLLLYDIQVRSLSLLVPSMHTRKSQPDVRSELHWITPTTIVGVAEGSYCSVGSLAHTKFDSSSFAIDVPRDYRVDPGFFGGTANNIQPWSINVAELWQHQPKRRAVPVNESYQQFGQPQKGTRTRAHTLCATVRMRTISHPIESFAASIRCCPIKSLAVFTRTTEPNLA
jgi:hypothetical protein